MKESIYVMAGLIAWASIAHASSVTVQGGYLHTPNSNYGDSGTVTVRSDLSVTDSKLGLLSAGGELGYHGKATHGYYGRVSGVSALGTVSYTPATPWKVKPYILGGLGWSWWDFAESKELRDVEGITIDLGDSLAEKVALGLTWPIRGNWSGNIEWSYFHTAIPKKAWKDGLPADVGGNDDRSGTVRLGWEETNLVVGLVYSF